MRNKEHVSGDALERLDIQQDRTVLSKKLTWSSTTSEFVRVQLRSSLDRTIMFVHRNSGFK